MRSTGYLRQIAKTSIVSGKSGPQVYFFPWLGAKPKHIERYINHLYSPYNCNIELVESTIEDFLKPIKTEKAVLPIAQEISTKNKVHIHAMSVGAYSFAVTQSVAAEKSISLDSIESIAHSKVWDSIVIGSEENMKKGMVEAVPKKYQYPMSMAADLAMFITRRNWPLWNRYIDAVKNLELVETSKNLLVYSENDPMSRVDSMQELIDGWEKQKFDFQTISWKKSKHAQHLVVHQDEYLSKFNDYLSDTLSK